MVKNRGLYRCLAHLKTTMRKDGNDTLANERNLSDTITLAKKVEKEVDAVQRSIDIINVTMMLAKDVKVIKPKNNANRATL